LSPRILELVNFSDGQYIKGGNVKFTVIIGATIQLNLNVALTLAIIFIPSFKYEPKI